MSQPPFRRRDFLRSLVATVVVAGPIACEGGSMAPGVPIVPGDGGSGGGTPPPPPSTDEIFPQSVASGDPQPASFLLWTRVEPAAAGDEVPVEFVVATDEALTSVVAQGSLTAKAETDHTVRVKVTGQLSPGTHYYYQFKARGATSRVGRTKTAPAPDADATVRFAFASCQDFIGRYYHAWKALLDEASQAGKDLDFIVFLGDYIYETDGDPSFQTPGAARGVDLPVGKPLGDYRAATDVEDYRTLYKTYRGDRDLQAVHERFPFIIIWDDHEFANDSAGTRSSDKGDVTGPADEEREPARRLNATRAWFEYQPVDVEAPNAAAAPEQFKMYRRLRFGRHVELFMTDERLYRSGPLVPEGPANLAVGKVTTNSALGSHNLLLKAGYDPIETAAKPTMLGQEQKDWLVAGIAGSTATWKIWGNEVCLWQSVINLADFPQVPAPFNDLFYLSVDQWDGFRTERAEIFTRLAGVQNLVAVTGDVHSFYASELHVDFDAPAAQPVAAEFVVGGISSQPLQEAIRLVVEGDPTFKLLGLGPLVQNLDAILVEDNAPYLKHARTNVTGVAVVEVKAGSLETTFLQQRGDVTKPTYEGDVERTVFHCVAGSSAIVSGPAPSA